MSTRSSAVTDKLQYDMHYLKILLCIKPTKLLNSQFSLIRFSYFDWVSSNNFEWP